ncbi:MAG: RnfABCDGE type electron transport complex subunit D [Candidatus Omnitrophota bacterium]
MSLKDKELAFLSSVVICVFSAVIAESAISYLKERKLIITDSSFITGLIVGFVMYSSQPWWFNSLAAVFAIASKHLLRLKKKHIFNPAALGIFLVTIIFSASTRWQGTYYWHILVPFGLYFSYRMRKLEILYGYFAITLFLFGLQALKQGTSLIDIFGYLSYFYIFIMVIEPKTTPISRLGKYLFGALVAGLIFILTEIGVRFDAELCALLIMNMLVPVLNKVPKRRAK